MIANSVKKRLASENHAVDVCETGTEAYDFIRLTDYDVILMDIMLPGEYGLSIVRRVRSEGVSTPILFLTARDSVADRVTGLDASGEDLKKRIGFTGARDELFAMASAFDEMFTRLDSAFERERRFTSDASHELRTPVAGILAQSEFALSDAADDADRLEALREIHRRAGDMFGLIQRLLSLSRMDARRLLPEPEAVDLSLIAQIAAETFAEQGAQIDVRGSAVVRADQTMIAQAALNLVENAVKYGNSKVEIEIGEGRMSVRDHGPGIAPEHISHLFERFWQADSSHRAEGSGLGLPLAQRIMELHGGRVEVESRPGEGAVFALVFPKEE